MAETQKNVEREVVVNHDPYAIPVGAMTAQISERTTNTLYKEGSDEIPANFEE